MYRRTDKLIWGGLGNLRFLQVKNNRVLYEMNEPREDGVFCCYHYFLQVEVCLVQRNQYHIQGIRIWCLLLFLSKKSSLVVTAGRRLHSMVSPSVIFCHLTILTHHGWLWIFTTVLHKSQLQRIPQWTNCDGDGNCDFIKNRTSQFTIAKNSPVGLTICELVSSRDFNPWVNVLVWLCKCRSVVVK